MGIRQKAQTFFRLTGDLLTHEANSQGRIPPAFRFLGWQILKRVRAKPITISAFGSGKLRCYPDSASTNAVIYYGQPDWAEMTFLKNVLQPGDGFIDIGANVGVYSILAAQFVGPQGRVVAFEPDPKNLRRLKENFELNGIPEKGIHGVAVGESRGTCSFEVGMDSVGAVLPDHEGEIDPPVNVATLKQERLDAMIESPEAFGFAKMDVEGFELQALKGATGLLESGSPFCWLLETNDCCEAYGTSITDIQEYMAEYGYTFYRLGPQGANLTKIPLGGPYPLNSVAIRSSEDLTNRSPSLQIQG